MRPTRLPIGAVILAVPLLGLAGCESDCLGDQCPGVPDEPWDPDEVLPGDELGYGYGDEGGGATEGRETMRRGGVSAEGGGAPAPARPSLRLRTAP